jgi:hypothetical protein
MELPGFASSLQAATALEWSVPATSTAATSVWILLGSNAAKANVFAKILSWAERLDATDAAVISQMLCSLKGRNLLVNLLWSQSRNAENNGNAPTSHCLLISLSASMAHVDVAKTKASLVKQPLTLLAVAQTPTLLPI